MQVVAHNVKATVKNRLKTPRLVIVEFILNELPKTGSAGQLLHLSLSPNYIPNPHHLHHEQIPFDVKDDNALAEHKANVLERIKTLKAL